MLTINNSNIRFKQTDKQTNKPEDACLSQKSLHTYETSLQDHDIKTQYNNN